jgi:fibronectin type 3 domain-containing protein
MCRRGPRKAVVIYFVLLLVATTLVGVGTNLGTGGTSSSPGGGSGILPFNVANPAIDVHAIKSCSAVTSCESPSETLSYPGDAIFVFLATNFSGAAYVSSVKDQAGHTLTNLTHASLTISNNRLNVTVYEEYNVAEYSAMTIFVNTSASETFGFEWVAVYGTTTSPVDALGTASTGHGTASTATVTTATANDLVLMGLTSGAGSAANSAGTGNTLVANTGSTPTGTVLYETRTQTGSLTTNATLPSAKSWAAIDVAILLGSPPAVPTGLAQSSATWTTITWTWNVPAGGDIVNYSLARFNGAGCTSTRTGATTTSPTYTVGSLNAGTARWAEVAAYNSTGASAYSACYGPAASIAGPPTSPSAAAASTTSVLVSWTNPVTSPTSGVLTDDYVYWEAGSSCSAASQINVGSVATTYTVTGLTTGTQYCFYVEAVDNGGTSNATGIVTAVTAQVPGAPTGLTVGAVTTTTVPLSWSAPSGGGILNYTLYWFSGASCSGTVHAISVGTGTSETVSGLTSAVEICAKVTAWNATGQSSASSSVNGWTLPTTPIGPSTGTVTTTSIVISWTNPSGTIVNDTVYRYVGISCSGSVTATSLGSSGVTSTQSGLSSATNYAFAIQAWSTGGGSALSICVTKATLPGGVTGLTVGVVTATTISISWTNPSGSLDNDTVYQYTGASCSGSVVATSIGGPATSNTQTGLSSATEYAFIVQAWSTGGAGADSSCVAGWDLPAAPTSLTATGQTTTTISLSWSNPSGTLTDSYVFWEAGGSCSSPSEINIGSVATTYTKTGLTTGNLYCFYVEAVGNGGASLQSTPVTDVTASVPGPATGLAVSGVTSTTISLTWTNPTTGGIVNDTIWYGTTCGSLTVTVSTAGAATSHTVNGLTIGTSYCFSIQVWNATGGSTLTAGVVGTTANIPPPVMSLIATSITTVTVTLSWSGSVFITNVTLYVSVNGCTLTGAVRYSEGTVTTATAAGLTASTAYCFAIRQWNASGGSIPVYLNATTLSNGGGGGGGSPSPQLPIPNPSVTVGGSTVPLLLLVGVFALVAGALTIGYLVATPRLTRNPRGTRYRRGG